MKHLFFLLFVSIVASGQEPSDDFSVPVPDIEFEKFLIFKKIDPDPTPNGKVLYKYVKGVEEINDDNISYKHSEIKNLEGIQYFRSLIYLTFRNTQITTLDLRQNTKLSMVSLPTNRALTYLNIKKNKALKQLYLGGCNLSKIDLSTCKNLENLIIGFNKFKKLDVSNLTNLKILDCSQNQLTELDISKSTLLTKLDCSKNQLTELDISKSTVLAELDCSKNQLTELDLSNTSNIEFLACSNNNLKKIDVRKLEKLTNLSLHEGKNTIDTLDLTHNPLLKSLWYDKNTKVLVSNYNFLKYELGLYQDFIVKSGQKPNCEAMLKYCLPDKWVNDKYRQDEVLRIIDALKYHCKECRSVFSPTFIRAFYTSKNYDMLIPEMEYYLRDVNPKDEAQRANLLELYLVKNKEHSITQVKREPFTTKRWQHIGYMLQTLAELAEGKDVAITEEKAKEIRKFLGFNELYWSFDILNEWIWKEKSSNEELQKKLWNVLALFKGNGWTKNNLNGKVSSLKNPNNTYTTFDDVGKIMEENMGVLSTYYQYDDLGRTISEENKHIRTGDVYSTTKYNYLSDGSVERSHSDSDTYEIFGQIEHSYQYIKTHNTNGDVITLIKKYEDGEVAKQYKYTYTEYDHENNWIKREVEEINNDGKTTKSVEERTIQYHPN